MAILILNLLLESIFDFGKWSIEKSANTRICGFSGLHWHAVLLLK